MPAFRNAHLTMDLRSLHDVVEGTTIPSNIATTLRPFMTNMNVCKASEVLSGSVRPKPGGSHTHIPEEEENYLVKIENAEEFEEQVEGDKFAGEDMKIDIKEEDLLWMGDSYVSSLEMCHHLCKGLSDSHHLHPEEFATVNCMSDGSDLSNEQSEKTHVTLLENATKPTIWATSFRNLAQTLSSAESNHNPVPITPELSGSESSASNLSCDQTRRERCVQQYEEAIGLALNIAPKNFAVSSYSHCIARTIEIILSECPKDKQMLCGQQILTAALKIQMEMKSKSTSK